jgi:formylglycine-generating enzyme required for sulfatase activity
VVVSRALFAVLAAVVCGCTLLTGAADLAADDDETRVTVEDAGEETGDAGPGPTDAGADVACPSARGATMVRVVDPHGTFCIDTTETSNRQLNVFIASPERFDAGRECAFKTSYGGAARAENDLPATNVDWCDAWMYCRWAGKRLCGSRNGTKIDDYAPANDERVSEWYAACSRSGDRDYPYGDAFDSQACNSCAKTSSCADASVTHVPVGSSTACAGGYVGIFDMSGSVAEWEDNCDDGDTCPPRGGSYTNGLSGLTCAITTGTQMRNQSNDRFGIRCCAD